MMTTEEKWERISEARALELIGTAEALNEPGDIWRVLDRFGGAELFRGSKDQCYHYIEGELPAITLVNPWSGAEVRLTLEKAEKALDYARNLMDDEAREHANDVASDTDALTWWAAYIGKTSIDHASAIIIGS